MRAPRNRNHCNGCTHYRYDKPGDSKGWCGHPDAPENEEVRPSDTCADWEAWQRPPEQKMRLPWEYCECGCKGWNLDVGGVYFHLHWDLKDKWYLSREHGISSTRKVYKSAPEAEDVVKEALREALYARTSERADIKLILEESNG